jgi:hypothetical protein
VGLNLPHSGDYNNYEVSPDGQSLLVVQFVNTLVNLTTTGTNSPDPDFGLIVALNWTSSIEKQRR